MRAGLDVLLGFYYLLPSSLAAYVQWQNCKDDGYLSSGNDSTAAVIPDETTSFSAYLDDKDLVLETSRWIDKDACNEALQRIEGAIIDVEMLGSSGSHDVVTNATCRARSNVANVTGPDSVLYIDASRRLDLTNPLSTFHVNFDLGSVGCLSGNITPGFGTAIDNALFYVPLVVFLFVLLVGVLQSLSNSPTLTHADDEHVHASPRSIRRPMLPGVSDCLHHLQFVFLTGALSLRYPGFYQPATGHLSWFSLFSSSNALTGGTTYSGVADGIFEINGTYGGTFGLELMTQYVGAPMTMTVWNTMVILMIITAVAVAVIVEMHLLFFKENHYEQHESQENDDDENPLSGVRRFLSHVIRVILSYFLLPLVAISAYQLDNVSILPAYHTALAASLLIVIALAFLWLLFQGPTRRLGLLILDSPKAYQQLPGNTSAHTHKQNTFVLFIFTLSFIRGAAIGGLQISGLVQLLLLAASEAIMVVCIAAFQVASPFSTMAITSIVRLASVAMMATFIPGVASLSTKSAVGYCILVMHFIVLLFSILPPAIIRSVELVKFWRTMEEPRVYNLRQLHRRQASHTNLSQQYQAARRTSNDGNEMVPADIHPHPTIPPKSPLDLRIDTSSGSQDSYSRFYRPSRSPLPSASSSHSTAEPRSKTPTRTSKESAKVRRRSTSPNSPDLPAILDRSLARRWKDYSFREQDLYYSAAPPGGSWRPEETQSQQQRRSMLRKAGVSASASLWDRLMGKPKPDERGFQVVRRPMEPGQQLRMQQQWRGEQQQQQQRESFNP